VTIQLKSIEDLDPLQRLAITEFSYSRIDTYNQCATKYFFSYIKKEPRLFGEAATLRKYSPRGLRKRSRQR
jgi:hypothetical protein